MNADGSHRINLASYVGYPSNPAWSPDGTMIAFHFGGNVYVTNADGSGRPRLTIEGGGGPTWSPDGRRIAFVAEGKGLDGMLSVVNRDGSGRRDLATAFLLSSPAWSPDGRKIAYQIGGSGRGGEQQVYVISADGSGRWSLTPSTDFDSFEPSWSPDGARILYSGGEGMVTLTMSP